MNPVPNAFSGVEAFTEILGLEDLLEGRFENDVNDNPIYIGYTVYPNADPGLAVWYIRKIIYVGTNIVRTQLPDEGIKFAYVWNDRATYFS